jgi:CRISPR system Cascade subunit CasA
MNLINDPWIPIRRKSGKIERIAPWQITDGMGADEIIELAAPRPDFNGALIQFLIGLLQTTFAPESPRQWRQKFQTPPSSEELKKAFGSVAYAFELDGDGPRFMQDLTLEDEVNTLEEKKREERIKAISELLIDAPTGKTLEDNTDHFIKRDMVSKLCPSCTVTALFTLQINAPSGGQGHRTGLRGGGPLTTLILGETLWSTCWVNTLERHVFLSLCGDPGKGKDSDRFPWLVSTRTSEGGTMTTPRDVHVDQIFWSMPRRIRLIKDKNVKHAICDLCGTSQDVMFSSLMTKNLGINYDGPWIHPLSPHFIATNGTPSAKHTPKDGIGYRHWLGMVQTNSVSQGKWQPARVVDRFVRERGNDRRLWAFGYAMAKKEPKKPLCWYDSTMPLVLAPDEIRKSYEFYTAGLINAAQEVSRETRIHVKKALFKPEADVRGDLSFIESRFWQETEADFFKCLRQLRDALNKDQDVVHILERWHKRLVKEAETIFNDVSQTGTFDAADPKRIALAWKGLRKSLYGEKLWKVLGMPEKH